MITYNLSHTITLLHLVLIYPLTVMIQQKEILSLHLTTLKQVLF